MPDYHHQVRPLIELLAKHLDGRWTEEHTLALNKLASIIHAKMALGLINYSLPVYLHVDSDGQACSGVLAQKHHDDNKVIAMVGRDLQALEMKVSHLE